MKYYILDYRNLYRESDFEDLRPVGHANGEYVPNGKAYFDSIGNGEIINNAPVFDYFHLESFGQPDEWEWKLQDIHGFIGVGSIITGWYISDKSKRTIESFNVAQGHHFYATKLLYKGEKLDYWIFQFATIRNSISAKSYINYGESVFCHPDTNQPIKFQDYELFICERKKIEKASNYRKDFITKKLVFNSSLDFIPLYGINDSGVIVSERLKNMIEAEKLEGFIFTQLEYEIEIP